MLSTIDGLIRSPRMKLLAIGLLTVNVAAILGWFLSLHGLVSAFHQPVGGDFIIFYAASKLTLLGQATAAFNPLTLLAAERSVVSMTPPGLEWYYPPPNQLLIAPLATLPYAWSYLAFLLVTGTPYLLLMRRIGGPSPWVLVLVFAFPGTFANGIDGQNGFLTTALMGWGLFLADRRPWLAGLLLGLLIYKPQFGLILPVVLVGTGNWRAVVGAALSACGFMAASTGVFGLVGWSAFLRALPAASSHLANGVLPWTKMPSVMAGLRSAGLGQTPATLVQLIVTLLAAIATLACWRRPAPQLLKVGTAVLAVFLMSPYAFNYDLVLLAVPIAALAMELRKDEDGSMKGAGLVMILLALLPTLSVEMALISQVQPSALILLGCFAALVRFTWRKGGPVTATPEGSLDTGGVGLAGAA